ncbi:DUF6177 family protein [Streptomyces sp. NPDC012510]|uniref:DUF6177 family protein n=1 Tax=Streptomyces sp. NPDC012510 TaxID=3364838 RepID=UPI0036E08D09
MAIPATGDVVADFTGIDVLTDKAAVVLHDRPLVAATTWLTDVVRTALETRRELHIVTPPGTRLALPTRTVLERMPSRWVVRDPERSVSPFSGSGLVRVGEEALAGEAAVGDVHVWGVGGQAE